MRHREKSKEREGEAGGASSSAAARGRTVLLYYGLAVVFVCVAIAWSGLVPTSYDQDRPATRRTQHELGPSTTGTGFLSSEGPPHLCLRPDLTAQTVDFDASFAGLWASKQAYLKYPFDAHTVTTKLIKLRPRSDDGDDVAFAPGLHFAVQKVEGRKSRPINPVAELPAVVQPFTTDPAVFNFNEKNAEEILFTVGVMHANGDCCGDRPADGWTSELAGVLINSHPFAFGCTVIIVRTDLKLPQVMTKEAVEVALLLAAQSTEGLRIGYNSLAGGASVNHLHFQGWYFNATPDGMLPVENAPYVVLSSHNGVTISRSKGYPLRSLLFSAVEDIRLETFASAVFACVEDLLQQNYPHNIVFSRGGREVYLIPRRFAVPNRWQQRTGFPEVAGQIVTVSEETFDAFVSEEDVMELLGALSLDETEFGGVIARCAPPSW